MKVCITLLIGLISAVFIMGPATESVAFHDGGVGPCEGCHSMHKSAFIDGNTSKPVLACPPYSEKFGGADIISSLRVPSGIGSVVTIEPEGAAIAAAKILALQDPQLEANVKSYQEGKKKELDKANESVKKLK